MTKRKRYAISAAVLAACVGIALCVLAMLPTRPGVTKAKFDSILRFAVLLVSTARVLRLSFYAL